MATLLAVPSTALTKISRAWLGFGRAMAGGAQMSAPAVAALDVVSGQAFSGIMGASTIPTSFRHGAMLGQVTVLLAGEALGNSGLLAVSFNRNRLV